MFFIQILGIKEIFIGQFNLNYVKILSMKVLLLLPMFFCSLVFSEDFNLICEGERKVRNLSGKEFNVTNFESVLLKINNNTMEYIGVNS